MGSHKDERLTITQSLMCGGLAGIASRTFTSPLDVVKILAQVGTQESKSGLATTFKLLYKQEGLRAFWKGNLIACMRLFPYNGIQFTTYNYVKNALTDPHTRRLSHANAWIAGSLSGFFATIVTYPMDVVKTRLTVNFNYYSQTSNASNATNTPKYAGMFQCFRLIIVEEGLLTFYKGFLTSLIGVIPFAGGTFMAYEFLDRAWGKPRDKMTPIQNFINGCLAASFAQTFSYPFDTIRKKLQTQSNAVPSHMLPDVQSKGMVDCFVKTVQKNGILGLWRGTAANLLKVAPYYGMLFASFEACKRLCLYSNGYTTSPFKDQPKKGVDQTMTPEELRDWYLKKQNFNGKGPP